MADSGSFSKFVSLLPTIEKQSPDLAEQVAELKQQLGKSPFERNQERTLELAYNLAFQHQNLLEQSGISLGGLEEDFRQSISDDPHQAQPTSPAPQGESFLSGLIPKRDTSPNPSEGIHTGDSGATNTLRSTQEQELLEQFQEALAKGDQATLEKLLNNIEAPDLVPSLFNRQLEILSQNLMQTEAFRKASPQKREEMLSDLTGEMFKRKSEYEKDWVKEEEWDSKKTKTKEQLLREQQKKKYQEDHNKLKEEYEQAKKSGSRDKQAQAFQSLLSHRMDQVYTYHILDEYVTQNQDLLLLQLSRELAASFQQAQLERAQQMQAMQQQAAQIEGAQRQQAASRPNPLANILGSRGGKKQARKSLKNQIANKALDEGAKALGPEAVAALWIVRHWKLVLLLIIVVLAIWIGILVALFSVIAGHLPGQSIAGLSSCTTGAQCEQQLESIGITVNGDTALNGDPQGKVIEMYNAIKLVSTSPFLDRLGASTNPITITLHPSGCAGHASYTGHVDLYWCNTNYVVHFMILHELGHEIAFRNPQIWATFYASWVALSLFDRNLPTFNCQRDYGIGPFAAECFADMVGEYVVYPQWRDAIGVEGQLVPAGPHNFPDFPTFANGFYYNFAKYSIFGGVEFNQ